MSDKEEPKISPEAQQRLDEALDELFAKRREEEKERKKKTLRAFKNDHSDDRPFSP